MSLCQGQRSKGKKCCSFSDWSNFSANGKTGGRFSLISREGRDGCSVKIDRLSSLSLFRSMTWVFSPENKRENGSSFPLDCEEHHMKKMVCRLVCLRVRGQRITCKPGMSKYNVEMGWMDGCG